MALAECEASCFNLKVVMTGSETFRCSQLNSQTERSLSLQSDKS
jgi:hypothetical protein